MRHYCQTETRLQRVQSAGSNSVNEGAYRNTRYCMSLLRGRLSIQAPAHLSIYAPALLTTLHLALSFRFLFRFTVFTTTQIATPLHSAPPHTFELSEPMQFLLLQDQFIPHCNFLSGTTSQSLSELPADLLPHSKKLLLEECKTLWGELDDTLQNRSCPMN